MDRRRRDGGLEHSCCMNFLMPWRGCSIEWRADRTCWRFEFEIGRFRAPVRPPLVFVSHPGIICSINFIIIHHGPCCAVYHRAPGLRRLRGGRRGRARAVALAGRPAASQGRRPDAPHTSGHRPGAWRRGARASTAGRAAGARASH